MSGGGLRYHIFETQAGHCAVAWTASGIVRFHLPSQSAEAAEGALLRRLPLASASLPDEGIGAIVDKVQRYFRGEAVDFSETRLDLGHPDAFFARVYDTVRRLNWGETTTYGAIAKELGAGPEAARTVGQVMATNPIPLIIPCHRVLAAGNKIGGFSAPGGSESKRRMLEMEGVRLDPPKPVQQELAF